MDVRLAQLDRAFGYGPKGRGFESSSARFFILRSRKPKKGIPAFLIVSQTKRKRLRQFLCRKRFVCQICKSFR